MDEPVEMPSLDGNGNEWGSSAPWNLTGYGRLDQGSSEFFSHELEADSAPAGKHDPEAHPIAVDVSRQTVLSPSPSAGHHPNPSSYPSTPHSLVDENERTLQADPYLDYSTRLSAEEVALLTASEPEPGSTTIPRSSLAKWSEANSWFYFPAEIRVMIYAQLLRFPDATGLYAGFNRKIDNYYRAKRRAQSAADGTGKESQGEVDVTTPVFPSFHGEVHTPTILLLSRRINRECRPFLQPRNLILDRVPPWLPGARRPMMATQFISRSTLQLTIKHVDVRITLGEGRFGSGWVWLPIVRDLLSVLHERNSFRSLRFVLKIHNTGLYNVWAEEAPIFQDLMEMIDDMRMHNPTYWQPGKVSVECWYVVGKKAYELVKDKSLPRPWAIPLKQKQPDGIIREYPDDEIWPGSILEFL